MTAGYQKLRPLTRRRGAPGWMVTFADLMALLLALFVLLLSFSEIDSESFKKNAGPINEAFNASRIRPTATVKVPLAPDRITHEEQEKLDKVYEREEQRRIFIETLQDVMIEEIRKETVQMIVQEDAVIIRFPDKSAFPSGSMDLTEEILPTLDRIADTLTRAEGNILVSGHTDNDPIATSQFRSNWDLSTERAVSVVHRLLQNEGLGAERITAQGFGDSRPLADNATPKGRAANRRVEIIIEMEEENGGDGGAEREMSGWGN